MTKASEALQAREESIEALREIITPGQDIYSIVRKVSQSGMSRQISFFIVEGGEIRDISFHVSRALGYTLNRDNFALKVGGAGMDMCFHVVYSLGRALWPEGMPEGGHPRREVGTDAGYALNSRNL